MCLTKRFLNCFQVYLEVEDGHGGLWWEGDGGDGADVVAHGVADLHLGVAGKAPEDGIDQGLGHILLHLVGVHGEVHVLVVVQQDVPHLHRTGAV